jgi:CBS domain-containing protein
VDELLAQTALSINPLRVTAHKPPSRELSIGFPVKSCILPLALLTKICCMKRVSDIFSHKGRRITSVAPEVTVLEALKIMADQNIGSVMVIDNQRYLGIVTERDYSRKVILKGKSSTDTKVIEIMTNDLPWVNPSDTVEHCMQLMSDKNIRYLPVFENDKVCGIVSINDLVRETILTQQETISQLKDYLHASM